MTRVLKRALMGLGTVGLALWLVNTSTFTDTSDHMTRLIAHRGVHQVYTGNDRSATSCHAAPIAPVQHTLIENTIPSMQAAFQLGADVVELDIHLTADEVFAVFHDWTLDCRTDGTGVTHKQRFSELQKLDVGYRLDDGTETFPLRGAGIGLMPRLTDVFDATLQGRFLINFKSNRAHEGKTLGRLMASTRYRDQVFGVYGGAAPTQAAIAVSPGLRGYDRSGIKSCLLRYAMLGWNGYVPNVCRNTILVIPSNVAPWLWGWPHRLTQRMRAAGTDVVLLGPYDGSGFSSGIDTPELLSKVPQHFDGYVWTDRIEVIGPLLKPR